MTNMKKRKYEELEWFDNVEPKKDDDTFAKAAIIFITIMLLGCMFATYYLYQLENYYS